MKHLYVLSTCFILFLSPVLAQNATKLTQAIRCIKSSTLPEAGESHKSTSLLKRAMPAVQNKNPYWEAITNELLGLSYKDIKDTTVALRYLEQARTQYTKLKYVASGWAVNEISRNVSIKNTKTYFAIPNNGPPADLAKFNIPLTTDSSDTLATSVV